jgi:hypothetical protein
MLVCRRWFEFFHHTGKSATFFHDVLLDIPKGLSHRGHQPQLDDAMILGGL